MWKFVRGFFIVIITVVVTTLVINATDNRTDLANSILGNALNATRDGITCPSDMVAVSTDTGGFCIDIYEASANQKCVHREPMNQQHTRQNLQDTDCGAQSVAQAKPWRNIARHQAELACAAVGKRLPTNKEWYRASLGTPDTAQSIERSVCHVNDPRGEGVHNTGVRRQCVSTAGAFDMIGNVWEWVDETVVDGTFKNRTLPSDGYVSSVDSDGVPTETRSQPDLNFNKDYFWVVHEGSRGMIRGGFYGSESDAGYYALNAATQASFAGTGIGFRCAK